MIEIKNKTTVFYLVASSPDEVVNLFFDLVKVFDKHQYTEKGTDGKEYIHSLWQIHKSQNGELKVHDVIYPTMAGTADNPGLPTHLLALRLKAWKIGEKTKIQIEYSPFFENMIFDQLKALGVNRHIEAIVNAGEEKAAGFETENKNVPKTKNTWKRWREAYHFIKSECAGLEDKDIIAQIETDHPEWRINNNKTLIHVKRCGENGYLDNWESFCKKTGRSIL